MAWPFVITPLWFLLCPFSFTYKLFNHVTELKLTHNIRKLESCIYYFINLEYISFGKTIENTISKLIPSLCEWFMTFFEQKCISVLLKRVRRKVIFFYHISIFFSQKVQLPQSYVTSFLIQNCSESVMTVFQLGVCLKLCIF